jgi:heterogeneous nuclear rnp K-like protein
MGAIIGRDGAKIRAIQDDSGARLVTSRKMLPRSTERPVEVQGSPDAIGCAIEEIGRCLLENWDRGLDTVLYSPVPVATNVNPDGRSSHNFSTSHVGRRGKGKGDQTKRGNRKPWKNKRPNGDSNARATARAPARNASSSTTDNVPGLRVQTLSVPSDMVGCIIGRGGSKITEIRRLSGSKISIAKTPHDETGERLFTITGIPEANEKALVLLYCQLESEKERRQSIQSS